VLQPGENTVTIVNAAAEGGFSLPPYVLLADATVSVDVASAVDRQAQERVLNTSRWGSE
jgi:hypothetical protein